MKHWGTVYLESSDMVLRRFTMDDIQPMYEKWASDPDVTRFLSWAPHMSPEITRDVVQNWILRYRDQRFYQWAIVPKALKHPIGSISIVNLNDAYETVEVGFCIGTAWWNQGYTSLALRILIQFFFEKVGVNRIEGKHVLSNPHSGMVMEKCGMQFEGIARQAIRTHDRLFHDAKTYAIIRDDFRELCRASMEKLAKKGIRP